MQDDRQSCDNHLFFFSSRRRHTRSDRDWSSDVCSSDLLRASVASSAIATSFEGVVALDAALARKATVTGNPVRPMVLAAAALPYAAPSAAGADRKSVV